MYNWIIISPDGTTVSPTEIIYENFQVLGIVRAFSQGAAMEKLKKEYPFINGSGYDKVWIYQLRDEKPYITNIENKSLISENEIEDDTERKMVEKMIDILKETGYSSLVYGYCSGDSYHFEGYSDAFQEIRVDVDGEKVEIYDRYIGEKHFVYMGSFRLK